MHRNAYKTGKLFFDTYVTTNSRIVEIGSQNVYGSLKDHCPNECEYLGLDFVPGEGVDIVLTDHYSFPFHDNTFDFVVTSSCFEHAEMFWLSFLEGIRILKPNGIMYCNAPSSWMSYHKYPLDCWRFYPDAAKGLESWAKRNKYNTTVLETYITVPDNDPDTDVCDWVAVFLKDARYIDQYKNRMLNSLSPWVDYFNAYNFPQSTWGNPMCEYHQAIKKNFANNYNNIRY